MTVPPQWLCLLSLAALSHGAGATGASPSPGLQDPPFQLDRPWVGDVFFYWYEWDEEKRWGSWAPLGVYYTPLVGYYDSRKYEDNLHQLWMASEWGLTHHFIDFWGKDWKDVSGREPRENVVFRAAEALRARGYPIWLSFYQDGSDFEMRRFRDNATPGRHLRWILENYARSPVFPCLQGRPFYLVYGRSGAPLPSEDADAFRHWLRQQYGTLASLNAAWQTAFGDWQEIGFDTGGGRRRADTLCFYFDAWRQEWQALDNDVQQQLDLPGVRVSFDVGYQPYRSFGYSPFAAVFGGPHSYSGIAAQPHDQDVQRLIHSLVARYYGTLFFDYLRNFYNDWSLNIPGMAYPAEPFHFDRFWVGDLLRYAQAVLHPSWNEWWEGSNLEPCYEYGKAYCEKNLLYSTLMHLAFPSLRDYARDAQVAVLLNDAQFLLGGRPEEDLYPLLQNLRRLTIPFELLPDDFVTAERLARFRLVIAPAGGVGFGENAEGQPISQVLEEWAQGGPGRHLLISPCEEWRERLDLDRPDSTAGTSPTITSPAGGRVIYTEGPLGLLAPEALEKLLAESEEHPLHRLRGEATLGTVLEAGDTLLALAYHEDITHPTTLEAELAAGDLPLAEAVALSADGLTHQPLDIGREGGKVRFTAPLHYYGVYALVRCPVSVTTPALRLHPGEARWVEITLRNLTDVSTHGFLRLHSIVPTLGSSLVEFRLAAGEQRTYPIELKARADVDWGRKTVALKVNTGGRIAYFLRELTVAPLPQVRVETPVVTGFSPRLTLANPANGSVPPASVEQAVLEIGQQRVRVGDIPGGGSVTVSLPLPSSSATPQLLPQAGTLHYRAAGQERQEAVHFHWALLPTAGAAPPDALRQLWVVNGRESAVEQELVVVDLDRLDLPAEVRSGPLRVLDEEGGAPPAQIDFGRELVFSVTLPPHSVRSFWLCTGAPPEGATDLHLSARDLGSGTGVLTLGNAHLEVVLDESRGGTVTTLRSLRTGRDYGGGAFGAAFGHFGTFDPLQPMVSADRFIQESKVCQRDSGVARLRVLAQGPLRVIVEAHWQGEPGRARQVYELRAASPTLQVESAAEPGTDLAQGWRTGDEVVVMDARLARHHWTKVFPNFTGRVLAGDQPHGGWRQAPYVPPLATLMETGPFEESIARPLLEPWGRFEESLSFLLLEQENLDLFRQGFWPERRPQPGTLRWAELEYGATRPVAARVKVRLLFHDGTHTVGEQARAALPLLVQVEEGLRNED